MERISQLTEVVPSESRGGGGYLKPKVSKPVSVCYLGNPSVHFTNVHVRHFIENIRRLRNKKQEELMMLSEMMKSGMLYK